MDTVDFVRSQRRKRHGGPASPKGFFILVGFIAVMAVGGIFFLELLDDRNQTQMIEAECAESFEAPQRIADCTDWAPKKYHDCFDPGFAQRFRDSEAAQLEESAQECRDQAIRNFARAHPARLYEGDAGDESTAPPQGESPPSGGDTPAGARPEHQQPPPPGEQPPSPGEHDTDEPDQTDDDSEFSPDRPFEPDRPVD